MSRLLAPALAVLFLAALIGCGGGGTPPSFDQDPDTTGTTATVPTTSGNTDGGSTVDLRPAAGSYAASLSGGTDATTFTATGTASATADGVITVGLPAASSSDGTARAARIAVAKDGSASGTVTVGTAAAVPLSTATLTRPSTGGYLVTATFTDAAAVVQTYRLALTAADLTYAGPNLGTDNQGGTYTGTGTAKLGAGNVLSLTYTSIRPQGSVSVVHTHRIVTTLASGGTFTGTLDLGTQDQGSVPATGTWSLSGNTLTVTLKYVNSNFVGIVGGRPTSPNATEKLTLTKQ